ILKPKYSSRYSQVDIATAEEPWPIRRLLVDAFQRPRGKADLSIFHRDPERDLSRPGLTQFLDLALHQVGELVERRRCFANLASRLGERLVQLGQLVDLADRIAERRDAQNPVLRSRPVRLLGRPLVREWSRPPFLARSEPPIPQLDEGGES